MSDLEIRPYTDADEVEVLELLAASLGKIVDERYRRFFRWKHLANPFGRSFMWIAERDGRILGFRSFLRWRFVDPSGEPVEAVRAVDTATHPDARGAGIFRSLTLHGLDEMRPAGISFVWNTPNDQSRPGYLKMGWTVDGQVAVKVRSRSLGALARMARARTAADTWSLPTTVGEPVDLSLDRFEGVSVPHTGLATDRSPDFLRWRYAACPDIASRAVPVGGGGMLLVRFRRRGPAVECTVGDVLGVPSPGTARAALGKAMRTGGAHYALAARGAAVGGMVTVARLGPVQTRRALSPGTELRPLELTLGDVELL